MIRRIVSVVLLCAIAACALPACVSTGGGGTTQPVVDQSQIDAALKVYDYWRARVDLLAKIAMGPNPDPKTVEEYNRAVWYLDVARQVLVILGAPAPAQAVPKMVAAR